MRIAVIGSGRIGGTLGGKWQGARHDVVYGLQPVFAGDAGATATVDALPPLWAALSRHHGDRHVALRITP